MKEQSEDSTGDNAYYGRLKYAEKTFAYPGLSKEDISKIVPVLETFFDKVLDNLFSLEKNYEKEN